MDLSPIINPITTALESIVNQSHQLTGVMAGFGTTLVGTLLLLVLSWEGVKIAMEMSDINETIAKLVGKVMIVSITLLLFDNYDAYFGYNGYLFDGFNQISARFGAGDIIDLGKKAIESFLEMAGNIIGLSVAPDPNSAQTSTDPSALSLAMSGEFLKAAAGLIDKLVALIIRSAAAIVAVIAGAIYVAQMVLADMAVVIGVIIGPIMIPWLMLPATSFLFDGWLRFMIVAGMWKVVGAVVFKITSGAITSLSAAIAHTDTYAKDYGTLTLMSLGLLIATVILAFLMSKIPDFANSLVSGGGVSGISGRWAAKAIMGGAASTSKAAIATRGGVGSARNAVQGYKAARAAGSSPHASMSAGARHAAQTAGYRMQNMGKIEKPSLPKPKADKVS
ncbi:type IV secretion system protein [Crenobacter sp. SG2305]|uniref:type IV secretion system protein n=1 Tax=Crenobacter oryzisoli TaxID=3056844 RepID=UPI0025AA59A0|nr:type IV secretion system protein [Crenobacter sp. SG2305]MDN0082487.1 type IV secretion system protein [Crenobacter sp. SG2305]